MQQMEFVPCNYWDCYFCKNGHTTGIVHCRKRDATVVFANGVRLKTKKCVNVRVNLGMGGNYCKMCYRKQDKGLTWQQKKKLYNLSRLGCVQCRETVCKACWDEGYDMHSRLI